MKLLLSLLLGGGILLLGASLFWASVDNGSSTWTDDKAAEYQEVSARLHGLSFRDLNKAENKQLYDDAESQYRVLDEQLQNARSRGNRTAYWLKIVGGVLAAVGGVGYLLQRDAN